MGEIINFEWCEKHNMELFRVNVARDKSFYLEKDGYCCVVYTESSTGEKTIHIFNPSNKKQLDLTMPKISFNENKHNEFTVNDLKVMCELVGLEYPF